MVATPSLPAGAFHHDPAAAFPSSREAVLAGRACSSPRTVPRTSASAAREAEACAPAMPC